MLRSKMEGSASSSFTGNENDLKMKVSIPVSSPILESDTFLNDTSRVSFKTDWLMECVETTTSMFSWVVRGVEFYDNLVYMQASP